MNRQDIRPGLVLRGVPHPNDQQKPGLPPNRYNREIHDKIVELIKRGFTDIHVAAACGISKSTFADWVKRGLEGDPWLVEFAEDVERARAFAMLKTEESILNGLKSDGSCPTCGQLSPKERMAAADLALRIAERRDTNTWNKQQNIVIRNELQGFLEDCKRQLPPKTYYAILQIAAGHAGGAGVEAATEEDE